MILKFLKVNIHNLIADKFDYLSLELFDLTFEESKLGLRSLIKPDQKQNTNPWA